MNKNFSEAVEALGKKKEQFDFLMSRGIKYKEKLVTQKYNLIKKGFVLFTGQEELTRLRKIKKLRKYRWKIFDIPEKEAIFLLVLTWRDNSLIERNVSRETF